MDRQQEHKEHVKSRVKKENGNKAKNIEGKGFAFASGRRAQKGMQRQSEKQQRRLHVPINDLASAPGEKDSQPPLVVIVAGPKGIGKTILIRSLIKKYSRQNIKDPKGLFTLIVNRKRRITLIECPNDLAGMIDACKVADLVLLMVSAEDGFSMSTFELLNVLQVHGFPRVIGILNHLDNFKSIEKQREVKKTLKHRFWTELYEGAKLFYLSGILHDLYLGRDMINLCRFISVTKPRPLIWRNSHSYLIADRIEDLTPISTIENNEKSDRQVCFYGYLRGIPLRPNSNQTQIHIPGAGDFSISQFNVLEDPCPLPETKKESSPKKETAGMDGKKGRRRTLNDRQKMIYAPYSDLSGVVFDQDAIYIDMPTKQRAIQIYENNKDKKKSKKKLEEENKDRIDERGEEILKSLAATSHDLEVKVKSSQFNIFKSGKIIRADEFKEEDDREEDETDGIEMNNQKKRKRLNGNESDKEFSLNSFDWIKNSSDSQDDEMNSDSNNDMNDDSNNDNLDPSIIAKLKAKFQRGKSSRNEMGNQGENKDKGEDGYNQSHSGSENENSDTDDEMDFEDLENGENSNINENHDFKSKKKNLASSSPSSSLNSHSSLGELSLEEKKAQLKKQFDAEFNKRYDPEQDGDAITDPNNFYEQVKANWKKQMEANQKALEKFDPFTRMKMEGYKSGSYVRIVIDKMPCEFVINHHPESIVLLGGLLSHETTLGLVQAKVKKHRWFPKTIKNNEPLVISMGWRRFQTIPLISMKDASRNRLIKYTPDHLHCLATFYGPITAEGVGLCAFRCISEGQSTFRIAATGVIDSIGKIGNKTENISSMIIMKKLKLVGYPHEIHKNTAFIKGMFGSELEVARFEGAMIKTVSGIRGQIKKAIRAPAGAFRAGFEDKILKSDIVFLRTWFAVQPRQFYTPMTDKLLPSSLSWTGMRLNSQIREEAQIDIVQNQNSFYRQIERQKKGGVDGKSSLSSSSNPPIRLSEKLKKNLPFLLKPKAKVRENKNGYLAKRAVMLEPEEQEQRERLKHLKSIQKRRDEKQKERRETIRGKYLEKKREEEEKRNFNLRAKIKKQLSMNRAHKGKK